MMPRSGEKRTARESPAHAAQMLGSEGCHTMQAAVQPVAWRSTCSRRALCFKSICTLSKACCSAASTLPWRSIRLQLRPPRKKGIVLTARVDGHWPALPCPSITHRTSHPLAKCDKLRLSCPGAESTAPLRPLLLIAAAPKLLSMALAPPALLGGSARKPRTLNADSLPAGQSPTSDQEPLGPQKAASAASDASSPRGASGPE
mmetsp:Transcript_37917/g.114547  ORF Transcript_37917/g.114547 Transcript_37917/m.114547 type:complete len:203 (-) Transcript_37917:510-1118(-)